MTGPDHAPTRLSISECLDRIDALLRTSPPPFLPGRRAARDAEIRRLVTHLRDVLSRTAGEGAREDAEAGAVLRRAQDEARRIVVEAQEYARRAIQDGTLARAAEMERRQLREQAKSEAEEMRREADAYAHEVLERLEEEVARILATVRRGKTLLSDRGTERGRRASGDGQSPPAEGITPSVDNGKMASV
jgi:hypothetical protein